MFASITCEWPYWSHVPTGKFDISSCMAVEFERRRHKPWCAMLVIENGKVKYNFLEGVLDFSGANSVGSRGVLKTFYLESGNVYRCKSFVSSRRTHDRYLYVMPEGEVVEVSKEVALRCLGEK